MTVRLVTRRKSRVTLLSHTSSPGPGDSESAVTAGAMRQSRVTVAARSASGPGPGPDRATADRDGGDGTPGHVAQSLASAAVHTDFKPAASESIRPSTAPAAAAGSPWPQSQPL